MLSKLELQETRDTPEVLFDPENNKFELSGNSLPEDTTKFFMPIFDWIDEYIKEPIYAKIIISYQKDDIYIYQTIHVIPSKPIYLKYFIVRNNVLAIAIVWHNATAVEKGTRAGRNTIANTGNPKPIFVWRNAPASAMKKSAMPMLIMHTIIADTSESWYAF